MTEEETETPRYAYAAIAEDLRAKVAIMKPGDYLPSEASLMVKYGVSRYTVRRSLRILTAEGRVEAVHGRGWRVADPSQSMPSLFLRMMRLINDDNLNVGDPYPSEQKLCARFGRSRPTIRRVLAQMEGAGYIRVEGGKRVVTDVPGPAMWASA